MQYKINSVEDYQQQYLASIQDPASFWGEIAKQFIWEKPFETVLEWNFEQPQINWFKEGTLNIIQNSVEKFAKLTPTKIAYFWEPNNPTESSKSITYFELNEKVNQCANAYYTLGLQKGDNICIYMPMVLEAIIAMLACAKIGAIHSVVFAGFSANSLADRMNDAKSKLVITADAFYRGDKKINLQKIVDEALQNCESVQHCILFQREGEPISQTHINKKIWNDFISMQEKICVSEPMQSEDPLFVLYTSGSTGKPKGLLHTTAGYMIYVAYTFANVFDYKNTDIFWCTADIGWITGHSYIVYGALLNGATSVIFEGTPTFPDHGRFWDIIEKYKVTTFYTAPTAIRSLESFGTAIFENKKLDSLRVLGSVGEPINEEAWHWYSENVGGGKCPIVDTWWQTETGGILISALANITKPIPAFATLPLPGIQPILVNEKGEEITTKEAEGNLCIRFPWPGMARTILGDHARFKLTYFSTFNHLYFTGDGAKRDALGNYRITGRVDDVINVSGHRIGTGEVEDAINSHDAVVESAVVGFPHDIKGQALYAFIILLEKTDDNLIIEQVKNLVANKIGSFAKPDKIQIVSALPKTRSGKIMRRILRKIAERDFSNFGDTSTLLDPTVVDEIVKNSIN